MAARSECLRLPVAVRRPRVSVGARTRLVVVSAALGALLASLAYWFIDTRLTELMLAQVTARAMDQVQLGVLRSVQVTDFEPPHTPQELEALAARLDPLVDRAGRSDGSVLRVNVFARDGTILYSDVPRLRGHVEPPVADPLLADALAGRARAQLSSLDRDESADLKPRFGQALEAYVPLTIGGRVVGVYELYQNVTPLQRLRPLVWGILATALGVVYAALVAVLVGWARLGATAAVNAGAAGGPAPVGAAACPLTPREVEVLRLLAADYTYRSIARELVVSQETVRTHVKSILRKLEQPDRREAVRAGIRAGILPRSPTTAVVG